MCQDPHGGGGDPDRAGTPNWAASQIPLDDQGRHTRRPAYGPRGHNVRPRSKGGWGMWLLLLTLAMCDQNSKPKGGGGLDLGRPLQPPFPERRPIQPHGGGLWGGPKDGGMTFRALARIVQALGRRHGLA